MLISDEVKYCCESIKETKIISHDAKKLQILMMTVTDICTATSLRRLTLYLQKERCRNMLITVEFNPTLIIQD